MNYGLSSEDRLWADEVFEKVVSKVEKECERVGDMIPYVPKNNRYIDYGKEDIAFWTNGFWGGMMWQLYKATGKEIFKKAAVNNEERLDLAMEEYMGLHHDVGFMWLHTAAANYRLTGNEKSKVRSLHAASLLAGRYNPGGKFISAWNENRPGWIIVDSMMNVPLLYWASLETEDPRFKNIAVNHVETVMKHLVREDGSVHHIAVLDTEDGSILDHPVGQGYASGSSWSRGQAWAIYGFAISYRYQKDSRYLDTAKKVAHYFMANVAQTGFIPRVDFRSPKTPEMWDTTAAMCAACGMLEISEHVDEYEKDMYIQGALSMLKAVEEKCCDWNEENDGIVGYGTVAYHRPDEIHIPIIYGDYFLIEALTRLKENGFFIW